MGLFGGRKKEQQEQVEASAPLLGGGVTTIEATEEVLHAPHVPYASCFNDGPRERRDTAWTIAYSLFSLFVVVFGLALFATGARDFWSLISPEHLMDPASCPLHQAPLPHARRGLLGFGASPADDDDGDSVRVTFTQLMAHPVSAALGTLFGSLTMGLLFVLGIRHRPYVMILMAIFVQVGVVAGFGVWLAVVNQFIASGVLFAYAALLVGLFVLWGDQIKLVGRLLGITGSALGANPSLVVLGLTTPVIWCVIFVQALALGLGAFSNGRVVPNPDRAGRPATKADDGHLQCLGGEDGTDVVICCAWEVAPQAWAFLTLLGVALTWTSMLLGEIKLFATAGTVAQWYFAKPQDQGPSKPSSAAPRRPLLHSLRHALGPQFGSLCAASALLTVISYLRQALDAAEKQTHGENKVVAIICLILVAILRVILSFVEFLTRFTTVRMAVTGEAFMDAARGAVDLFKRNALDAFGVWWLPPFILGHCTVLLSVLLGAVTWATANTFVYKTDDAHDGSAVAVGLIAFVTAWAVLSFLSGLLQNVIESVFLCFAMDRDAARITRPEVHVILQELPPVKKGAVVEQPDGQVAYGAGNV